MEKSNSAFTPGPWRFVTASGADGDHEAEIQAVGKTVAKLARFNRADLGAHANARLIAAAPELYEALERYRKAMDAKRDWPENDSTKRFDAMLFECELAEAAADAALAKARGDA